MRWIRRIIITFLTLTAVVAGAVWFLSWRSLPDYAATLQATGLSGPVEIVRTEHAIPHVFADSDADVFFGLGYAHAQDRLWQMEMFRRTAQGRLSEMLGEATLPVDELLRRFDLYAAAESSVDAQSAFTKAALTAYAAGVNARLAETRGWGLAAPEFLLFPVEIEAWKPADSLAILKLIALQLASHVDREVLRARVSQMVPSERLRDILPDDPNPGIQALPGYSTLFPDLGGAFAGTPAPALGLLDAGPWASNAWAAGPARSVSGKPILANDTHLNFSAPTVWYLARLDLSSGPVIGGTIPGIPTVLSGRNPSMAWALTAANMDDQDVFIERLNPDDPAQVMTPAGWQPLRTDTVTIRLRGGEPIALERQWSDNGPIIPGKYYNLAAITPPGHVAAIARTLFEPADTSLTAAHGLLRARSVDEAIAAVEDFVTPAQNLTMVDDSHIGLQMIGRIPQRQVGHTTLGRMPSEGWIATNRWGGSLAYLHNPRFVDPLGGVIGNTNSKTVDRPFPFHVSFDWGDTQRIHRWEELMASRPRHDLASFAAAQADDVSYPAKVLVPLLLETLGDAQGRRAEAVALLGAWDARMHEDQPAPVIYAAWMLAVQRLLPRDELGALAEEFTHANPIFIERVLRDTDGAAIWCDDTTTPVAETCADAMGAALDEALAEIAAAGGTELAKLRWGDVHQATHDHQVLGGVPILGRLVNIRQSTSGGDNTLLRGLTHGTGEQPLASLRNLHGALYRSLVDMAAPESSKFVISTGQSGHPLSAHYRDLGKLWREGGYVSMAMDEATVRAAAAAVTRITPAGG